MIDVERLKHDPEYWDEVAPDGAEYYITSNMEGSCINPGFYFEAVDRYVRCVGGEYWWKDSDITAIPRPVPKQWSGPEDGLPEVGSVMEFTPSPDFYDPYPVDQWVHGDEIDILAHVDKKGRKIPVAYNRRHQTASTLVAECIQPARTEKERVVEAARDFFTSRRFCPNDHDLGAAYDAGFLKMPESDQ